MNRIDDGIHKISNAEYHGDPCQLPALSSSIARVINERSAAHAWQQHPRGGGERRPPTADMIAGSAIDSLLLGGDVEIVEIDAKDFRTAAARTARDEAIALGKIPMLTDDAAEIRKTAEEVRRALNAYGVVFDGENQLTLIWTERATNGFEFQAKARLDHLSADGLTIFDLKTTESASPRKLGRKAVDFGYDIQAAAYVRGYELLRPELAGRVRFVNVWAELKKPFGVCVTQMGPSMRTLGRMRWEHAVNEWGHGLATGNFRGYPNGGLEHPIAIECGAWDLDAAAAVTMPAGGSPDIPF